MGAQVETFPAGRASTKGWAAAGAVVLFLAALGAGVLIGRAIVEEPTPPPPPMGLASADVVQALDANMAAWNAADAAAVAARYAPEAIFVDGIAGTKTVGADEIASTYVTESVPGEWDLERVSEVVQVGDHAASAFTYANGSGIAVYELDGDLRIVRQWVMGV